MKLHSFLFFSLLFLFVACGKDGSNENVVPDPPKIEEIAPLIKSITATCFYGSTVVITGTNFSAHTADNVVKFGDITATVTHATSTSLTVIAPDLEEAAAAEVRVTRSGVASNSVRIVVDVDQNKVATYKWTTHSVKPGVTYKTGQFNLFGTSLRRIHVLDVMLTAGNSLRIGVATPHKGTVALCKDYKASAGVNAGYFPLGGASDKDPYIRIDGKTVQNGHLGVSQLFTNAALLIHDDVASVRKFRESGTNLNLVASAIPPSQAQNIMVCGPMLISEGIIEDLNMSQSHNSSLTGRTGIGVTEDGKRIFMVVMDYNGDVTGVNTLQLAKILQALGAVNAMNLDGGGSSTMFVENMGEDGRVSHNTFSQRMVKSVIYVR